MDRIFKTLGFSPREYSPLYKPTHYVPPKRVWFLYLFGLKTVGSWRTRGTPPPRTPRSNPAPQRISVFQSLSVPSKWCKKTATVYIILGLCVNYWERNLASFFIGYVVLLRTWFLFWLLLLGNSISEKCGHKFFETCGPKTNIMILKILIKCL